MSIVSSGPGCDAFAVHAPAGVSLASPSPASSSFVPQKYALTALPELPTLGPGSLLASLPGDSNVPQPLADSKAIKLVEAISNLSAAESRKLLERSASSNGFILPISSSSYPVAASALQTLPIPSSSSSSESAKGGMTEPEQWKGAVGARQWNDDLQTATALAREGGMGEPMPVLSVSPLAKESLPEIGGIQDSSKEIVMMSLLGDPTETGDCLFMDGWGQVTSRPGSYIKVHLVFYDRAEQVVPIEDVFKHHTLMITTSPSRGPLVEINAAGAAQLLRKPCEGAYPQYPFAAFRDYILTLMLEIPRESKESVLPFQFIFRLGLFAFFCLIVRAPAEGERIIPKNVIRTLPKEVITSFNSTLEGKESDEKKKKKNRYKCGKCGQAKKDNCLCKRTNDSKKQTQAFMCISRNREIARGMLLPPPPPLLAPSILTPGSGPGSGPSPSPSPGGEGDVGLAPNSIAHKRVRDKRDRPTIHRPKPSFLHSALSDPSTLKDPHLQYYHGSLSETRTPTIPTTTISSRAPASFAPLATLPLPIDPTNSKRQKVSV